MQIIQLGCEVKYSACTVQNMYTHLRRFGFLFYFNMALLSADISNMMSFPLPTADS
jgi:hypothetical protein